MSAPDFLDINILVCAYDVRNPAKQQVAQSLLHRALAGHSVISTEVLAEFSATLLHKAALAISPDELIVLLDALSPIKVVPMDNNTVRRAAEAQAAYKIHFCDGMIIAAAEKVGCRRIWSEDLNSGQEYFGVYVENPFT